jgi:hypothetical protein
MKPVKHCVRLRLDGVPADHRCLRWQSSGEITVATGDNYRAVTREPRSPACNVFAVSM